MTTKFLLTALTAGLLMGLAFAGTELFNPHTAAAEANRMTIEAQHQQAIYQLDEQVAAAKTDAEIKEIQRQQSLLDAQYQHDIQALNQDLVHQDLAFRTGMIILTIIGSAFSLTLLLCTTIWIGSKAWVRVQVAPVKDVPMAKFVPSVEQWIPNLPEREPYDALDPKQVLFEKRLNERLQEIAAERDEVMDAELMAARIKSISDPGKMSGEKRSKLPLAGD